MPSMIPSEPVGIPQPLPVKCARCLGTGMRRGDHVGEDCPECSAGWMSGKYEVDRSAWLAPATVLVPVFVAASSALLGDWLNVGVWVLATAASVRMVHQSARVAREIRRAQLADFNALTARLGEQARRRP